MLRLDLTHYPDAHDAGTIQHLGAITITDDGTGDAATGCYDVSLYAANGNERARATLGDVSRQGGVLALVWEALNALDDAGGILDGTV